MAIVYLDQTEMLLKKHGFVFTGASKPFERLTVPVEIDENVYELVPSKNYIVCQRRDGEDGNFEAYMNDVIDVEMAGHPEDEVMMAKARFRIRIC